MMAVLFLQFYANYSKCIGGKADDTLISNKQTNKNSNNF